MEASDSSLFSIPTSLVATFFASWCYIGSSILHCEEKLRKKLFSFMGLSFWACCSFEINILWNKKLWELLTKNLRPLRICYKSRREEKHPNLKWFWELSRHFFIIFPGRKPIKSIKYQKFRIRNMYKNCAPWQRGIIITAYRITISLQTRFSFSSILSHFRISITWGLFEHEMKGKDCWVKYFPISQYHWLSVFFWNIKLLFHWGIIGKSLRSLGEKIKCMLILLMTRSHNVGWKRSQLTIDATLNQRTVLSIYDGFHQILKCWNCQQVHHSHELEAELTSKVFYLRRNQVFYMRRNRGRIQYFKQYFKQKGNVTLTLFIAKKTWKDSNMQIQTPFVCDNISMLKI